MTRQEIMDAYDVDTHGIITSPGKFEAEPIYAPAFYEMSMDGTTDPMDWPDNTVTEIVTLGDEDRTEWPELPADAVAVAIDLGEQGFVYVSVLTQSELDELEARNAAEWDAQPDDEADYE